MNVENPNSLIDVMVAAALHAKEIITRKHIVEESKMRSGIFITSLRSNMQDYQGSDKSAVSSWMTQKGRWRDILVICNGGYHAGNKYDISNLIESAENRLGEANPESIKIDLQRMDKRLDSSRSFIVRAKNINDEAARSINELSNLSNKIEEELVA